MGALQHLRLFVIGHLTYSILFYVAAIERILIHANIIANFLFKSNHEY